MPATTGSSARCIRKRQMNWWMFCPTTRDRAMLMMNTISRKAVPQRGCRVVKGAQFSGVRGEPDSWQYTVLCSAP